VLLRRFIPDRGRRYLQAALLVGALVTVVAIPMIYLRESQPAVKALLLRNYGLNLSLILGLIAVITLSLYAIRVAQDRSSAEPANRLEGHLPS
jgi:nitrogen fixation/metabolism regulation signal transduction histidine kinase